MRSASKPFFGGGLIRHVAPCALLLRPKVGQIACESSPFARDEVLAGFGRGVRVVLQLSFTEQVISIEPLDGIAFGEA